MPVLGASERGLSPGTELAQSSAIPAKKAFKMPTISGPSYPRPYDEVLSPTSMASIAIDMRTGFCGKAGCVFRTVSDYQTFLGQFP